MRLIDADKLLKGIAELKQSPWYENFSGRFFRKEAVEIIEDLCIKEAPTIDAVEVVRCKDCKFGVYEKGRGIYHTRCEILEFLFQDDDYCSYGERKADNEEW